MPEIIQSYSSIEIPCFQQLFLKVRIFLQTIHFQGFLRLNALLAAKALFEPFITNSDKPTKRLQIILTFFKKVLETICLPLLKYFRTYDEDAIVTQLVLLPMTKFALSQKIVQQEKMVCGSWFACARMTCTDCTSMLFFV